MKNIILSLIYCSTLFLYAQEPQEVEQLLISGEVNTEFVIDYIKNQRDSSIVDLLVMRSLEKEIERKFWLTTDSIFDVYLNLIDENYEKYDLSYIERVKDIINAKTPENETHEKVYLNRMINTENDEYDPLVIEYPDGKYIYFTRKDRDSGSNDENIFIAVEKENFDFSNVEPFQHNTNSNPEAFSFASKEEPIKLIFYGHYGADIRGNIYITNFINNGFEQPVKLSYPINTDNFEMDGILYEDKFLLFVSDRPHNNKYQAKGEYYHGDYWGNSDIYASKKLGENEWSNPINLGKNINTDYGERNPWISEDGLTLYFSSDGHPGLGRMDVFKSTRTDRNDWTSWSVPQNLGKTINTPYNDIGYKIFEESENTLAFFATLADRMLPDYDIAYIKLSKKNSPIETPGIISGHVEDEEGSPIKDLPMVAEDPITGEKLGEAITDENGDYEIPIPKNQNANIYPKSDEYIPETKPFISPPLNQSNGNKNPDIAEMAPRKNDGSVDLSQIAEDWEKNNESSESELPPGFELDEKGNLILPDLGDGNIPSIRKFDDYYENFMTPNFNDGVFRYKEKFNFKVKAIRPKGECEKDLITMNTINFDSKSSDLLPQSMHELNRLANFLQKNKDYFMLIVGHTDSDSTNSYNLQLSIDRANSLKDYLISKGSNESNFLATGKGEDFLLTDESTPKLKRKNRRVEFCINIMESPDELRSNKK